MINFNNNELIIIIINMCILLYLTYTHINSLNKLIYYPKKKENYKTFSYDINNYRKNINILNKKHEYRNVKINDHLNDIYKKNNKNITSFNIGSNLSTHSNSIIAASNN
jgi:hypothetical protein